MSSFHQLLLSSSSEQAVLKACRHLDDDLCYVRGHIAKNEHMWTFC